MKKSPQKRRSLRRAILFGVLGVVGLCLGLLIITAAVNASLPEGSADPEQISAEQAALMEEVLHLKSELGDQVWPDFGAAVIPLHNWNEANAFLCAHPAPPAGWEPVPGVQVAGQPCYRSPWENGQNFALEIGGRWTGSLATREWALITLRQPITELLPGPLRLVSPAFLLINEMMRPMRYIGGEIHESFHAFQAETLRTRFDDAEQAYPAGSRYWELDEQMHAAWEAEIEALYRAVYAENDAEARDYARQYLDLRAARRSQYLSEPELVRYEQRYEWLEGLAKYVELQMLRAAHQADGYEPVPALQAETSFTGYAGSQAFWDQEMSQMKRQATAEGDTRFYYTGNAQAVLLDRWMPGWKARVGEPEVWLEDLLAQALAE